MHKLITLLIFFSTMALSPAQNWRIYTTANSNSPHDGYNMIAIDTGNVKYFNQPGGFSGDQTISFDNDTTWQSKLSQCGTVLFAYGRASCFDKNNVLWEKSSNNDPFSLTNGVGGYWTAYNSAATGITALDGVRDITVDHHNNKWFATYMGVVKYDDTTFTIMDTSNSNIPFLDTYKIVCDKNDNVWVTGNTALAKYDGVNWTSFPLPTANIYKMVIDSNDVIWFGQLSAGTGLYKFDGTSWTNYNTTNSSIPANTMSGITVDKNNKLWFSFSTGLCSFDGTTWTPYDSSTGYPGTGYGFLNVDRYNNLWNTCGNGVIVFNETGIIGIEEIDRQMGALTVYPNPAASLLTLEFTLPEAKNTSIEICNIFGKAVKTIPAGSCIKGNNKIEMNVSDLSNGMYFVRVKNENKVYSRKFIKQ